MKVNSVVVVGVGGVGMAHVVAAGQLGMGVLGIADASLEVLIRAQSSWCNRFDGLVEETPVQNGCHYALSVEDLRCAEPDLVIIAVPPTVSDSVVRATARKFPEARILCEKPMWLSEGTITTYASRLTISGEYMFLSGMSEFMDVAKHHGISILSTRPTMTTDWGFRLNMLHDYGPHLLSLLWRKHSQLPIPEGFEHVPKVCGWESLHHDTDFFHGIIRYDEHAYTVTAIRSEKVPYGWKTRGIDLHWEDDLFHKQLQSPNLGIPANMLVALRNIQAGKLLTPTP
jgi:hypothetical protein